MAFSTFINIDTRTIRLSAIAFRTGTITDATRNRNAFSARWTFASVLASGQNATSANKFVRRFALTFSGAALFANHIRISIEIRRTEAFVAAWQIFTQRIHSASRSVSHHTTFIDVHAFLCGGITLKALPTNAHIFPDVIVDDAILAIGTWVRIIATARHEVGSCAAIGVRIAWDSIRTLTRITAGSVDANRSRRANRWISFAFVVVDATANAIGRAHETGCTQAFRLLIDNHAMSVGSTGPRFAWMPTIVAYVWCWAQASLMVVANRISWTIGIRSTRHHCDATHTWIWIGDRALGTDAFV